MSKQKTTTFFRVEHEGNRAFLASKRFNTLDEAKASVDDTGFGVGEEYKAYWEQVASELVIYEITEIKKEVV